MLSGVKHLIEVVNILKDHVINRKKSMLAIIIIII